VESALFVEQAAAEQALAVAQHSPVFNLGWRGLVHCLSRYPILFDHALRKPPNRLRIWAALISAWQSKWLRPTHEEIVLLADQRTGEVRSVTDEVATTIAGRPIKHRRKRREIELSNKCV
jgi:hypothetical protein